MPKKTSKRGPTRRKKQSAVGSLPASAKKSAGVRGGGFSIGKALGSVISAPFKAVGATAPLPPPPLHRRRPPESGHAVGAGLTVA